MDMEHVWGWQAPGALIGQPQLSAPHEAGATHRRPWHCDRRWLPSREAIAPVYFGARTKGAGQTEGAIEGIADVAVEGRCSLLFCIASTRSALLVDMTFIQACRNREQPMQTPHAAPSNSLQSRRVRHVCAGWTPPLPSTDPQRTCSLALDNHTTRDGWKRHEERVHFARAAPLLARLRPLWASSAS
ncbi:hypothetical protein K505DRAFT_367035 [Melanomma pulvis-pyrius CBS 109.77]|uniref:Uncharacterized protein n=1 Tax=Melanomma pulvis-pyrius CBS 109.77 TaxID=1314802 RepID=A0A6A6WV55_9PLEO|nr:hypothetical protein K505DRAFT_367035 [Melanomma pulvis-pyrius CBS 109.77]